MIILLNGSVEFVEQNDGTFPKCSFLEKILLWRITPKAWKPQSSSFWLQEHSYCSQNCINFFC